MDIASLISNIHWVSVLITTIFSFALGALWHQKFLFGNIWKEKNKSDLSRKMNIPLIFGGTAIVHFVALAGLSAIVSGMNLIQGAVTGISVAVVWMLPAMAGTYLFANRSLKLLAIDAGMYILLFAIAGGILAIW